MKTPKDRRDFLKSAAGLALSSPLLMGQQPPAAPVPLAKESAHYFECHALDSERRL